MTSNVAIPDALARLWDADDDLRVLNTGERWHLWGSVRVLAERLDAALGDAGRVAVVLDNSVESVAAIIAILRGGRTLVTLSPLQPVERLVADLRASGVGDVLAPAALWTDQRFADAIVDLGATGRLVDGGVVVTRVRGDGASRPPSPGVAFEMLTSGTTGPPKRIPLSYRQLTSSLASRATGEKPPWTGRVSVITMPIVHIGGLWALVQVLTTGRPFVLLPRFTVDGWHAAVRDHGPTLAALPPAALRSVLDAGIPREDLASLRAVHVGSSPVDPALVDEFYRRYGVPILIVYGATEFVGSVTGWSPTEFVEWWDRKRGSVGRAFPGVRLRVVDDDGAEVSVGTVGRLQIASARAGGSGDDWVTTSDLGRVDEDGFLYVHGRADDVIMRGGFKVAPQTVVTALCRHEAVSDAAVAGLPHPRLGQVPVAAVELRHGMSAAGDELREHCRGLLTPYEVPAEVVIVDELPRGPAMKVDRRQLLALLADVRVT